MFSPISQKNEFTSIQFYPSQDFLNASRLKLKKSTFSGDNGQTYEQFYEQLTQDNNKNTVNVNFGSISMVCTQNTTAEQVYQILKEVFSFIILNPKDKTIRLNLKNFGTLLVNQAGLGYIQFVENMT